MAPDRARHVLVIDQGTTSTRSMVFDDAASPVATAQLEFGQIYPRPGWVEHDPEEIWSTTLATAREAIGKARIEAAGIAAIGIANQRETVVVWDRRTGRAIHNAIVWQDRRTAAECARLEQEGVGPLVTARTGLRLDPYFSATKIAWMLDTVEGSQGRRAGRAPGVRHRRQLPAMAADRRRRARDGRDQCVAHPAVRHPPRPVG